VTERAPEPGLLGLAIVAVTIVPSQWLGAGPTVCPFRRLTGRPCPACGMTRSWNAASRFQLRRAFRFHPLGPPTLAVAAWVAFTDSGRAASPSFRRPALAGPALAAWLSIWVIRLLRG
jgi:hypothetical protein